MDYKFIEITMQIFVPFASPLKTAEAMINDQPRYNKQIIECQQILDAISGKSKAWRNHPVVKMYAEHQSYLQCYMECLKLFRNGDNYRAIIKSNYAIIYPPPFLTPDFCDQHKRRLYTKSPERYPQFAEYGTSDENWYFVEGELKKYINGKIVK